MLITGIPIRRPDGDAVVMGSEIAIEIETVAMEIDI
jgi:hypothetical protein